MGVLFNILCLLSLARPVLGLCWSGNCPTPAPTASPTKSPFQLNTSESSNDFGYNFDRKASVAFAIIGAMLAFYFEFQYVINGRFHQLAYYRRHILERAVTYCRVIHTEFEDYLNKKEEEKRAGRAKESKRTWLFLIMSFLILTLGTVIFFLLSVLQLLFDAVLVFNGLGPIVFKGTPIPAWFILKSAELQLAFALNCPWIYTILDPFAEIIFKLSSASLDLSVLGIRCNGMKLPMLLFFNVLVLGVVIIVVESNYVVFEQISLRKTMSLALKATMHPDFKKDFGLTDGAFYFRLTCASVLLGMINGGLFTNALKMAMTTVNLVPFFTSDWSENKNLRSYCNQSGGLDNFAAQWAIFLAALAVPAFIYTTLKFLVPVSIFEEGMHPHEVEASKNMFKRLWTVVCAAGVKEGQAQTRTDEQSSYRTEQDKYNAKKRADESAARLGLMYSYLTPDLWFAQFTKISINAYYGILHLLRDPLFFQVAKTLGQKMETNVFEIASGSSKDPKVMDGWEHHYALRLPSLYNFVARVGEHQRLVKAIKNLHAKGEGACHPAYKAKVPIKTGNGKVQHVDAVVQNTHKGMRHKVKQIDRDVALRSGRRELDPPLTNLLNSDTGSHVHWTVRNQQDAWLEINLGQPRIVTGYGLCKTHGDSSLEPTSWTMYGLPLDPKGVKLHKQAFTGVHPLDQMADSIKEGNNWIPLHTFSEGQKGHFAHITHQHHGGNFVEISSSQKHGGRMLWRQQSSMFGSLAGMMGGENESDWELFQLTTPVTVTKVRIVFKNTRANFSKGVSIAHMHFFLDKDVNQGWWLFAQIWRFCRIVVQTYFVFITACLGIWSNSWAIAFEVTKPRTHPDVPNVLEQFEVDAKVLEVMRSKQQQKHGGGSEKGKKELPDSGNNILAAVQGIIGARAVLFQAIPGLSFLTVWTARTVDGPLYVKDQQMEKLLPPFFTSLKDAVAEIKEQQPELPHLMACLQAPKHMWENSRIVKFLIGAGHFIMATCMLFAPNQYAVMLTTAILLLPLAAINAASTVASLALVWDIKSEDLDSIFGTRTAEPPKVQAVEHVQFAANARRQSMLACSQPAWKAQSADEQQQKWQQQYEDGMRPSGRGYEDPAFEMEDYDQGGYGRKSDPYDYNVRGGAATAAVATTMVAASAASHGGHSRHHEGHSRHHEGYSERRDSRHSERLSDSQREASFNYNDHGRRSSENRHWAGIVEGSGVDVFRRSSGRLSSGRLSSGRLSSGSNHRDSLSRRDSIPDAPARLSHSSGHGGGDGRDKGRDSYGGAGNEEMAGYGSYHVSASSGGGAFTANPMSAARQGGSRNHPPPPRTSVEGPPRRLQFTTTASAPHASAAQTRSASPHKRFIVEPRVAQNDQRHPHPHTHPHPMSQSSRGQPTHNPRKLGSTPVRFNHPPAAYL